MTYLTQFRLVFFGRMTHNGSSAGDRPRREILEVVMSDQWFEVVDKWTDARGEREAIVFCGPLQACEVAAAENFPDAFIRPISF